MRFATAMALETTDIAAPVDFATRAKRRLRDGLDAVGRERGAPLLRALLALVAILAIAQVVSTALRRLTYPFELEWMEGGVVDHVRVVLAGEPLYRAPSLAFTPFIYTPFYYLLCAAVSRVLGVGFFVPRLVSTLAMLGNFALVGRFVRREGAGRVSALASVGLFAVTFERSGSWMDIARVDSLFVFFLLFGAYLARHGRSSRSAVLCGGLLFLSFFTKQTGLTLACPVLAAALAFERRRGAIATATFATLTIGTTLWMNRVSGGWFTYYVFDVPRQHALRWDQWRPLLIDGFWSPVVVPVLLALYAFFSGAAFKHGRFVGWFYAGLCGAVLVSSYSSMLHSDGFANVLIPYYAVVSITAGIGLGWVLDGHAAPPRRGALQAFVILVVLVHFSVISYDHRRVLPRQRDVTAGRAMIAKLHDRKGPVLILGTGYYAAMAGHPEIYAHVMALFDVFKTHDTALKETLEREIVEAIQSKRFTMIVLEPSSTFLPASIGAEVQRSYRLEGALFPPADSAAAWPKTGFASRPEDLWVPRP